MGAEIYQYYVPYQEDIQAALEKLRQDVFQSGKYFGAELKPATPAAALELGEEMGTQSILDIERVAPEPDYGVAAPVTRDELLEHFGTETPEREMLEVVDELWESIDRGMCRYVVLYENDLPSEIYFIGFSYD